VKVQLIDGAYHEVDSSAIAFEIASRAALREGCSAPIRRCLSRS
jgi:elongation factor G